MSIPYNPDLAELSKFPISVPDSSDPNWVTYEEFTCKLAAPMPSIVDDIHHMATGCAGEAGELLDCSKKTWVYKKPLDRENMIEELGDLEWYMANMRQLLGVSRHTVLAANIAKLQVRYAAGYSNQAAIERVDKSGVVVSRQEWNESGANPPRNPVITDTSGLPMRSEQLHIIDMSKQQVANFVKEFPEAAPTKKEVEGADSMAASLETPGLRTVLDEDLPDIQEWTVPLLAAYHAGKTVAAIAYSKNTATVLFVGDPQPYKLYRPKGEV